MLGTERPTTDVETLIGRVGTINPDVLARLIGPDLQVSVDENPARSNCRQVTVTATLTPSLVGRFRSAREIDVELVVFDEFGAIERRRLPISSQGGSQTVTVALPLPENCVVTPGSWSRRFYIVADPRNEIAERVEGNNFAVHLGSCVA